MRPSEVIRMMSAKGFIIHHSACPSINGKGYDFLILKNASIVPAPHPHEPGNIHICLEGNFSDPAEAGRKDSLEQLFLLSKLLLRLSETLSIPADNVHPHGDHCPGAYFPWPQLVISGKDGYH